MLNNTRHAKAEILMEHFSETARKANSNNWEKFSEKLLNPPKRKRGRPRKKILDPEGEVLADEYNIGGSGCPRTQVERRYKFRAMCVLGENDDFKWIYEPAGVMSGTAKSKSTILAALGRVKDPFEMRGLAYLICQNKLKTRYAIEIIRQHRVGESPSSIGQLAKEILRTVRDYKVRHPSTSDEDVWEAFTIANACL